MTAEERRADWNRRYAEWQTDQARLKEEAHRLIDRAGCGMIYYDHYTKNPKGMGRGAYVAAIILTFEEFEQLLHE